MADVRQIWLRGYMGYLGGRGLLVQIIKIGPGNTPWNFVESCIAAILEFQYIFGEQKQTLSSPKTKVRVNTPGEIVEFCTVFWKVLVVHLRRTKTSLWWLVEIWIIFLFFRACKTTNKIIVNLKIQKGEIASSYLMLATPMLIYTEPCCVCSTIFIPMTALITTNPVWSRIWTKYITCSLVGDPELFRQAPSEFWKQIKILTKV